MTEFSNIKKRIEERKGVQKDAPEEVADFDERQINQIVQRMKGKYESQGMQFNDVSGQLAELKDIISGNDKKQFEFGGAEQLSEKSSPFVRSMGRLYRYMRGPLDAVGKVVEKFPQMKTLNYYLYSANMNYSARQWVALISIVSVLVFVFSVFGLQLLFFLLREIGARRGLTLTPVLVTLSVLLPFVIGLFLSLITIIVGLLIPKSNAVQRGEACASELSFALRHMAAELRSGLGLYKTIQTIAKADYGVLSDEFAKTISEIEEGVDTKDALKHFAARTQSRQLSNALRHIIRALKTGGNLSEIMSTIAQDVSFDLQIRIREYSERLNFFGVIFIFMGIVAPVFVGVLGAIANSGLPIPISLPLSPPIIFAYFLGVMPLFMAMLAYYLFISQPRG